MVKLLVITGPTATGKTKLGINLAKKFGGEIISADSQQVYQGKDEERGKDKELYAKAKVKVWGLDVLASQTGYSVSDFVRLARKAINNINARGKHPIVVGGSGQYIKELLFPSDTLQTPPNPKLRSKLEKFSVNQLQKKLEITDLKKWQTLNESDRNNSRRLVRAIEMASSQPRKGLHPVLEPVDSLVIGLTAPRAVLRDKIVQRRLDRPDLVAKEFALAKKQFLYQKKFLPAVWFDITLPTVNNRIEWEVQKFLQPVPNKNKNTLTTSLPVKK